MQLHHGDCLEVLRTLPDNSVDSVVTDPPYGLSFMGKKWDYDVPSVEVWRECLRVLKPGGHALIACGTRTQHRMAVNIEDAGFEVRDVITWLYGSGFPKSLDISKAIDKAAGAEREVVGVNPNNRPAETKNGAGFDADKWGRGVSGEVAVMPLTAPATDAAKQWAGYGTALKPACEFWTLARKPLEGTVANNVLKHGVGGLNIDGCRVGFQSKDDEYHRENTTQNHGIWDNCAGKLNRHSHTQGRFPANLILDEEAGALLDAQSGTLKTGAMKPTFSTAMGYGGGAGHVHEQSASTGGASRFFYCAKASKSERGEANSHPTVKPIALMRYLCRLITPPSGLVLDPFMGSGSTGVAALKEGFKFMGVEREAQYLEIARNRIEDTPHALL